jgi:hypothetical protein
MKQVQIILINQQANATVISPAVDFRQQFAFSVQAIGGDGSLAGTVQVQVNNTPVLNGFTTYAPSAASWTNLGTALTFSQTSVTSSQLVPKTDSAYVAMRVVFTDSSSGTNTANLTVQLSAIGV